MNEKRNERFEEYQKYLDKILRFTIFYMLGVAVFVNLLVFSLSRISPNQFPRTVIIGSSDTWIMFFGALFGGSLTVFGVLFSIIFSLKLKREEQLESDVLEITKNRPYIICDDFRFDYRDENDEINGFLFFKNLSKNSVRDLEIDHEMSFVNLEGVEYSSSNFFRVASHQFIGESDSCEVFFHVKFPLTIVGHDLHCHMHFEIKYHDLTGLNTFSHTLLLDGTLDIVEDENQNLKINYYRDSFNTINIFNWNI